MTTQDANCPLFAIALTMCDKAVNGFTEIGGAAWFNSADQQAAWARLKAIPGDSYSEFFALLKSPDGSVLEEKKVAAETCEELMGKSIARMIEDGRATTNYAVADMLKASSAFADPRRPLAMLDGRHVFEGSTLYSSTGERMVAVACEADGFTLNMLCADESGNDTILWATNTHIDGEQVLFWTNPKDSN